jgi:hypothetical protein
MTLKRRVGASYPFGDTRWRCAKEVLGTTTLTLALAP